MRTKKYTFYVFVQWKMLWLEFAYRYYVPTLRSEDNVRNMRGRGCVKRDESGNGRDREKSSNFKEVNLMAITQS